MKALVNIEPYNKIINECLNNFDCDVNGYNKLSPKDLGIEGDESNVIFIKSGRKLSAALKINFGVNAKNCCIYINPGIYGVGTNISMNANGNVVYLGKRCGLKHISMSTAEDGDIIIVGDEVTTTSKNMWTTGHYSGTTNKAIIIGDDCMFSFGISIRASDGHPVFEAETMIQSNIPKKPIVIEPHCWIGQDVSILKNVRIGACSIIASSTVVTKSCEKFSMMAGAPAVSRSLNGKVWGRNLSDEAVGKAKAWNEKYKPAGKIKIVKDRKPWSFLNLLKRKQYS